MKPIYYKKGQRVRIENGGEFEGMANLIEFVGKDDYPPYRETWKVYFSGVGTFRRTIIPGD